MNTIAFDVMGNDKGIKPCVEAAQQFIKSNLDYKIILVGDETEIRKYVNENEMLKIHNATEVVHGDGGARSARHDDSSMSVAIRLVNEGKAQAVLSSGDSAQYLTKTTLTFKRLNGIKRPAFMPIVPTIIKNKKVLLLDVGANLDSTGEMIAQWAELASAFSSVMFGLGAPRVAVGNIGTEEYKGHDAQKDAYKILNENTKINFAGFVEPRNVLYGDVDVIAVDGYAGNMILKTLEGTVLALLKLIKTQIKSKTKYKIGGLLAKGAFEGVKDTLDYRNVGAAWILGLKHMAVKAHGGSDKQAYLGALGQIKAGLDGDIHSKLRELYPDE